MREPEIVSVECCQAVGVGLLLVAVCPKTIYSQVRRSVTNWSRAVFIGCYFACCCNALRRRIGKHPWTAHRRCNPLTPDGTHRSQRWVPSMHHRTALHCTGMADKFSLLREPARPESGLLPRPPASIRP